MITTLTKLHARALAWWTCRDDRGDGTLSTVIIVAGFVLLAVAIVGVVKGVADGYKNQIQQQQP